MFLRFYKVIYLAKQLDTNIMLKFHLLFFLLSFELSVIAQTKIVVKKQDKLLYIGDKVSYLEDSKNKLTLKNILEERYQKKFKQHNKQVFAYPASNSAIWFKLIVQNKSKEDIWLEISNGTNLWEIDFYAPDIFKKYQKPLLIGALRPQKNKIIDTKFNIVPLAKYDDTETKTFYIKVTSKMSKFINLKIGKTTSIMKQIEFYDSSFYTFFGIILVMILYNSFLLISIKERIYTYYIAYLCYIIVVVPFSIGYPLFYHNWFWENLIIWTGLGFIIPSLFAFKYLNIKNNAPRLFFWILFLTIILGVVFPIIRFFNIADLISLEAPSYLLSILYNLSLWFTGVYLWIKGQRNAGFYVIAWFFVLITMFVFMLIVLQVLPHGDYVMTVLYFGFGMETILFAIALGNRFNKLKKEKEKVQTENLRLMKEKNEELDLKIAEKTKELQTANDEISAQNEEMLQMNEKLEQTVLERSNMLIQQNQYLKDYAFTNAHKVRGPLARILGLAMLIEREKNNPEVFTYIEYILESAYELDEVIKYMDDILNKAKLYKE